jgi:hypothetical protein
VELGRSRPFSDAAYDAIIYRSQFGETGYNVVLFKVEHAEALFLDGLVPRYHWPFALYQCGPNE